MRWAIGCCVILAAVIPARALTQPEDLQPPTVTAERRIYPKARPEVWAAAVSLFKELGCGKDRAHKDDGMFVTALQSVESIAGFDPVGSAPAGWRVERIQFHFLAAQFEAETVVHLNALVRVRSPAGHMGTMLAVGGVAEKWLLSRLDERLGVVGRAFDPTRVLCVRDGVATVYGSTEESVVLDNVTPPEKVIDIIPSYPSPDFSAGRSGKVRLRVVVDQLGTISSMKLLESAGGEQLDHAAIQAVALWRYRPAIFNGCRVPIHVAVSVSFRKW